MNAARASVSAAAHNCENVMAAALVAQLAGAMHAQIRRGRGDISRRGASPGVRCAS